MDFKNKVILAPMAGVTDRTFRHVCAGFGADCSVSEMISAKAIHYEDKKTAVLADIYDSEGVVGLQIFGHEPDIMKEASYLLSHGEYKYRKSDILPAFIDINMGCPVKKIVSNGDGSALMKAPELVGKIVSACVEGSSLPVTVKIRAGWDKNSINCEEVAEIAEYNGASAIAIHARTREQMYEPGADWSIIKRVKKSVSIPVIGNGDITSALDAERMMDETGCDSVMIGRGALGNPFIFDEIKHKMSSLPYNPPSICEKIAVMKEHVKLLCEDKGERVGVCESRKHISWYIKGLPSSASVRLNINKAVTVEQIFDIIDSVYNK